MVGLVVEALTPMDCDASVLTSDTIDTPVVKVNPGFFCAVIELFVIFAKSAHITVDLVHFGVHIIVDQLSQLEGVHAAGS